MERNNDIASIIEKVYKLPDDSLMKFVSYMEEHTYPKGYILYKQNEKASKIFFVKQGLVRAYAYRGMRHITFWFGRDGELAFPIKSVFNGSEEYASIGLLENSVIYEIKIEHLLELYQTDIHIANWGRRYAELACMTAETLLIDRQFKTTLERYQDLLTRYPDIFLRVPMGIIASYLGTSQVNLSRIRAKDISQLFLNL